jgi:protease I
MKKPRKEIKDIKNTKQRNMQVPDELLADTGQPALSADVLVKEEPEAQTEEGLVPEEVMNEMPTINNVKVAILSTDGFEEEELISPKKALEAAGAQVDIISPHDGRIKGWDKTDWGREVKVDVTIHDAKAGNYDAVVLPGGVMNPDKLRQNKEAVSFLKQFIRAGKLVAAICHGAQTLIETGLIKGKTMTSYPSLKTDLKNAGVKWVDQAMVHYGQFITSRKPKDLAAFNSELIYALSMPGQ